MRNPFTACLLAVSLCVLAFAAEAPGWLPAPGASSVLSESTFTIAAETTRPASAGKSSDFRNAKFKADSVESAVAALAIWQQYVDASPADNADLPTAREELAKWKKMAEDGAEKINGKWISGEERKALLAQVNTLLSEGREMFEKDQTLQAVAKLQAVTRLYPNCFEANAFLGFISIKMDKADDALRYLRQALKTQPQAAGCMSCMGLAYFQKRDWQQALSCFSKAAEIEDSEDIVQNLIAGVTHVPPAQVRDGAGKKALQAARLLEGKYKLRMGQNNQPIFVFPRVAGKAGGPSAAAAAAWSGTGFIISDDGLILTNRHVAKGAGTLMVMLSDKTTVSATVVAIDDVQDLALIQIKSAAKLPHLSFSSNDSPHDGADCTVMGFPLVDRLGMAVKVTKGIVTTGSREDPIADVVVDAKVNPGNSGGPMLDRFGQVMAIVSMKSFSNFMEDSYGLGIGAGRIRKFLAKNNIKLEAAPKAGTAMNTEDVAALAKPAVVCILATRSASATATP